MKGSYEMPDYHIEVEDVLDLNELYCAEVSYLLADIIEDNSLDYMVNAEGLHRLHVEFGNVPEELRGNTFKYLVEELEEREFPFDVSQFNADPSYYKGVSVNVEIDDRWK
jgi:hypothetical protein